MFEFPQTVECTLSTTSDASESHGGEIITSSHYTGNLGWHEGLVSGTYKPCVTEAFMHETQQISKFFHSYSALKKTSQFFMLHAKNLRLND